MKFEVAHQEFAWSSKWKIVRKTENVTFISFSGHTTTLPGKHSSQLQIRARATASLTQLKEEQSPIGFAPARKKGLALTLEESTQVLYKSEFNTNYFCFERQLMDIYITSTPLPPADPLHARLHVVDEVGC